MARKRLNKNLVAFLTVMGILLMVVVVFLATSQGARKDPEFWAAKAREREAADDQEMAIKLFERAYMVRQAGGGQDVSYLVEAARCAYQFGDIGGAMSRLERAHSEEPTNQAVLTAYLEHVWNLLQPDYYWRLPPRFRTIILEYAEVLQKVNDQHVLGPVSEAVARWAMEDADPANRARGDAALQRAVALAENDPRVVLARIRWEWEQIEERLRTAREGGAFPSQLQEIRDQAEASSAAILEAGAAANPAAWRIIATYVDSLIGRGQTEQARAVLERALSERESDPELHLGMAKFFWQQAARQRDRLTPAAYESLLSEATTHARRAVELDPAVYAAYAVMAQAELARGLVRAETEEISPQRYEAALTIYRDAIRNTAGVRSLQATLGENQRRLMYARAFNTALAYYYVADTPPEKAQRLEGLREFLEETERRYKTEPFTHYLRGQFAAARKQTGRAITAFERTEELGNADTSGLYPSMWFQAFAGRLPGEHLAILYRDHGQPGESLRYTDQTMEQYQSRRLRPIWGDAPPPLGLALNRAELLNLLDRPEEARDYVAELRRIYADELAGRELTGLRLDAVEATALRLLDRGAEGQEVIARADSSDPRVLLMQARHAYADGDFETAEARCRELLALDNPGLRMVVEAVRMLVPILANADRPEEGLQILADVHARLNQDGSLTRFLDEGRVVLSFRDPQERDAKLLELIAAEPDPLVRAQRSYLHYALRGDYEKAAAFLDEMEKSQPDDSVVLEAQFRIRLRLGQLDRAEAYAVVLAQQDADQAGGATYRGQLALRQDNPQEAVRWFREAQGKLPRSCGLQAALGQALLAAKRYPEAVGALREAVQLRPGDFNANKLLYIAYQFVSADQRPEDGGDSYLLRAARIRPNDPFIREQASLIEEKADPQAGIQKREATRAAQPQNVENLTRLAQLYAQVGDQARAAERFQEAAQVAPGDAALARAAADFYAKTGRRQEGLQHLQAFLDHQTGPQRGYAHRLLGSFWERLGDAPAAENAYREAQRVYAETIEDPEQKRLTVLQAKLDLIEFYRRHGGRDLAMIEACRSVLDQLNVERKAEAALRAQARLNIIQGLLNLGRLGEAEAEIDGYLGDHPEAAGGLVARVQLKLSQRRWDDAYETLTRVLQQRPKHAWSLLNRGRLGVRFGRYVEARDDLAQARAVTREARHRRPDSGEARLYESVCRELAWLFEITEQFELAEGELRRILELAEDRPDGAATVQQIADRLVSLHRRAGHHDKARQVVSEFMARYPSSPFWPYRLALAFIAEGEEADALADAAQAQGDSRNQSQYRTQAISRYETALSYLQRGWELARADNPGFAMRCLAFQLDTLAAAGRAGEAVQTLERLQESTDQVPAIVLVAMIRGYNDLDRRPEALAVLERALEAAARENAAAVQAVSGMANERLSTEQVIEVMRQVADRAPEGAVEGLRLRSILAIYLVNAGRPTEALSVTERVIAQLPAGSPEWIMTMLMRARALDESDDVAGAIQALEQVLATNPDSGMALNNLAYILADRAERPQEALQYAEQAREQEPRSKSVLDTLGWVYFKNGKFAQAEAALREAESIDPEYVPAIYHLGVLCAGRGRTAEARALLQRALEIADESEDDQYKQKIQEALDQFP